MKVTLNSLGELHVYSESELETYALDHWFKENLGISENSEKEVVNLVVHGYVISSNDL